MRLQLALDGTFHHSLEILREVSCYVDIVEIGTPLVFREGMSVAGRLRQVFPELTLLADLKIMDAGEEEAALALDAGCDIVTVLGVANDRTVSGAVSAARQHGKQVMADMMQVDDVVSRARRLLELGCDYLCVHTAYDLQNSHESPLTDLRYLRDALPGCPLAVAGGINLETIEAVAALQPQIVVVGAAITRAQDPAQAASRIRERMKAIDDLR
jgi:3-hexulose-6-phosphate synthase